ncbi:hypothetical protein GQX73_g4861 [Xylaria multiplex]|uniref:EKC/KEOPS complex subunit BUD32 n=1 Tax=Xylaria multiplex TaxID=323545 RepID=A0A7C8MU61_9PEZI|nr:hypothetical protein GQX73_g4861 [Xylaria multiplex]
MPEKVVREIQTLLRLLDDRYNRWDNTRWSHRPRLYAILNNIQAIELLDDFIREHMTDFNLPFNEQTLPQFISKKEGTDLRLAFFAAQDYYLTEVKDIESEKSLHLTLLESGDTHFISQRPLGQGSFGAVDLVFSRLIQIIGSYTDTEYIAYLMKPVASSTLEQFLNKPQPLRSDEKDILRPFYGCLAGAMNYLYTHRIRHRDLTARNILIDSSWKVYISDFGSSYSWEFKPSSKTKHRNVPTSPDYMAPEVAKEDERGTRSDMWSLGIVFLEMTIKLLGQRPVSLRNEIRQNADKEKVQPYPYANMTVLINWMKTLGATSTDYEHDKEPRTLETNFMSNHLNWKLLTLSIAVGWIRELLHVEHEHRPTPPQLMRYVFESPSLHAFCCLKCIDDSQNDEFTYGVIGPRTDSREDSQRTRQEVEDIFTQPEAISNKGAASIERWIGNSFQPETPAIEPLTPIYNKSSRDIDETHDFDSIRTDQFLYNTYEHEFYKPTYFVDRPENQSPKISSASLFCPAEPVNLSGDITWIRDNRSSSPANTKVEKRSKDLRDSGLGFLEYVSNSTDDEDKLELPFEEFSDRSSVQSGSISSIQVSKDTLNAIFYEIESRREIQRKSEDPEESSELRFDEEEDKSDTDNLWDEALDRSESSDSSQADRQYGIGIDSSNIDSANILISDTFNPVEEQLEAANPNLLPSSTTTKFLTQNNETSKTETGDASSALPRDDQIPLLTTEGQTEEANDVQEFPLSNMPSNLSRNPNLSPSGNLDKMDKKQRKSEKKKSSISSHAKTKSQKRAKIVEKVEYIEGKQTERNEQDPSPAIPDMIIDSTGSLHPLELPLSKNNLRSMNMNVRPPIVPRSRDALIPIDARKLMDNTWRMASSAPTSVMSEGSKSKISKFFFLIPNEQEIEKLLSFYCKKGSTSAVKTILQKASFKTKSLKERRYFHPLMHAVRGASSRHNKCVRELLAAGADPDQQSTRSGHTPLHIAVQNPNFKGYTNLIWLLLSNGANPNISDNSDEFPLAKLFVGADTGPLETHKRVALIMLLKEGAWPNFTISGIGTTPLHLAVRRQDKISVAMLLHMGAQVDAKTIGGSTPLIMTANQFRGELSADHAEVLDHLLQHRANVDQRAGAQGRTALHWAAVAGCAQAVTMLLEAGADGHLQDWDGCDAMWLAMKSAGKLTKNSDRGKLSDHVEIMLALEKATPHGLNLKEGECAIYTACKSNDGAILRQLLQMGLDPHSKFRQTTIFDFAMQEGSPIARQILDEEWRP